MKTSYSLPSRIELCESIILPNELYLASGVFGVDKLQMSCRVAHGTCVVSIWKSKSCPPLSLI